MKAIVVEHLGQPGNLRELADPTPGAREILIRVSIAGVNPVDWKIRDIYGHATPYTPGQDFAGTVVKVGSAVREYAYGDRVFGIARDHGAYAELTIMPVDDDEQPMAKIPDIVGDADAAGLPTPGLTALACIDRVAPTAQERVLIVGVTGTLGQIAAQLAIARGTAVTGIGSAAHESAMRALGVADYFAYDESGGRHILDILDQHCSGDFEAAIDLVHGPEKIARTGNLVGNGGILISTNHSIEKRAFPGGRITAVNVNLNDTKTSGHLGLRTLIELVEQTRLFIPIAAERNLSDAIQALDLVKQGRISGKMLVAVS